VVKRESVIPSPLITPKRAVLRTYELARGLDDSLEELVQIGVELDEEDGVDEGVEPQGIVDFMKRH